MLDKTFMMASRYMKTGRKSTVPLINTFSRATQICSGMVAGFGTIALLGWALDFQLLASIYSAYIPMAPNTATAFVVLGITLFVLTRWPTNHISRWVAKVTAIFVLLIGLMTLIQYVTDINLGIDQLLLTTTKTLGMIPVGFMSPITAANFFLAGFSSFNYLKHLPVDYLKIDGSFVCELIHNSVDQHLVKAIVTVAHGLGKQTVAEFVGCEETVQLLTEYGVDYAQGYHIGRPKAMSEI